MNIKQRRQALGLSQVELANRMQLSRPTLHKIETGARPLSDSEAEKLEQIFTEVDDTQSLNNEERISIPEKNVAKFQQVLLYILQKVGARPNVGLTVLYKLLYFSDFDYYEKYEEQLMGLTYIKNTYGPTPIEFTQVVNDMAAQGLLEKVRSSHFAHEQKKFLPKVSPNLSLLNGQELEMIDDVIDRYADLSAKRLSDLSHEDTPWKATADKAAIDYELAFYRPDILSVRDDYGDV